jgi:hypothetical protein
MDQSRDPTQCQIEQKSADQYAVSLHFSWMVSNGNKCKHGVSRLHATVYRASEGRFLIGAVFNEKTS